MSKQKIECEEFYEKYKAVDFKFLSYYKFTFTYHGFTSDGEEVRVDVGGIADYIYKDKVCVNDTYNIEQLQPYQGESDSVTFYDLS